MEVSLPVPGQEDKGTYLRRVVDGELDELIASLPAIAIEGPKGIGTTATAARRARTTRSFDDPTQLTWAGADARRALHGDPRSSWTNGSGFRRFGTVSVERSTKERQADGIGVVPAALLGT